MLLAELEYLLDDSIPAQRILRLCIGASDVRLALDMAACKLHGEVSAPGFRKGKAPLSLIRKHHAKRVEAEAFSELKQSALDQVFKLMDVRDRPFTPPELHTDELTAESDRAGLKQPPAHNKLRYGYPFEFAVKYLIDPAGISHSPEQPQQPSEVISRTQARLPALQGMGIPAGPKLPELPTN